MAPYPSWGADPGARLRAQVFKLMRPHYRYTLHINANARAILINAGGVLEQTFTTGRFTMEVASLVYGAGWFFDQAGFEADLIGRWAAASAPACCAPSRCTE